MANVKCVWAKNAAEILMVPITLYMIKGDNMKKILIPMLLVLAVVGAAQDSSTYNGSKVQRNVYRLKIKHADPQLVYLLLRGRTNFNTPPEISTIIKP